MRLTTLLFVIILGCAACSNPQLTAPEAVGHQVFEMLRSVPTSDVNDYMDNFITIEEIHAMAQDRALVKDHTTRQRMIGMTEFDRNTLIMEDRSAALERGLVRGVVWEDIEFVDFFYEVMEKEGIKGIDGELLFSSEEKTFSVSVRALWDGTAYRLSVVEELDEVGTWPRM